MPSSRPAFCMLPFSSVFPKNTDNSVVYMQKPVKGFPGKNWMLFISLSISCCCRIPQEWCNSVAYMQKSYEINSWTAVVSSGMVEGALLLLFKQNNSGFQTDKRVLAQVSDSSRNPSREIKWRWEIEKRFNSSRQTFTHFFRTSFDKLLLLLFWPIALESVFRVQNNQREETAQIEPPHHSNCRSDLCTRRRCWDGICGTFKAGALVPNYSNIFRSMLQSIRYGNV